MTNTLLVLILIAILVHGWLSHQDNRKLRELIDAFADMTGDLLKAILEKKDQPK